MKTKTENRPRWLSRLVRLCALWPATRWHDVHGRRPWWLVLWSFPWWALCTVVIYAAAVICTFATLMMSPRHASDTWNRITNA
jgi:hypothetical protein